jgi:hypothetical protein
MNQTLIDRVVQAVLYEGYILYPYRRGTKNHHRWTFGSLFPRDYANATGGSEPHAMQVQCLFRAKEDAVIDVKVQFLQLIDRRVNKRTTEQSEPNADQRLEPVEEFEVNGKRYQSWQEAAEQTVALELNLSQGAQQNGFSFPSSRSIEPIADSSGREVAAILRTQADIQGTIEATAQNLHDDLYQLTLRILNTTPIGQSRPLLARERALLHSMASTHAILNISQGQFLSLIDPPPAEAELAKRCQNIGMWPVLVGDAGATDAMLASPIILYDYPQIAAESPGNLFDGTEIDEILSLRILTLSDEEKRNAATLDERGAAMLNRTQALARDQLMRLHGTMRQPPRLQTVHVGAAELRTGDHVRLRPRGRADAFDIILNGKTATIVAIEQDFENRIHLAVTVDDDPGADIGAAGKIGHRFFFGLDEIEPLRAPEEAAT